LIVDNGDPIAIGLRVATRKDGNGGFEGIIDNEEGFCPPLEGGV